MTLKERKERYLGRVEAENARRRLRGEDEMEAKETKGGGFAEIDATRSISKQHIQISQYRETGVLRASPSILKVVIFGSRRELVDAESFVIYETDAYQLVKEKTLTCYQAAQVLSTAMTLQQLSIKKVKVEAGVISRANFTELQAEFRDYTPFRLVKVRLGSCLEIFMQQQGIFIIHCLYFHDEDWEAALEYASPSSPYAKPQGVDHYIVYNAGTRLLLLYPELLIVDQTDLDDLQAFERKLMQPPFKVHLPRDAGRGSRQLAVRIDRIDSTAATPALKAAARELAS